MTTTYSNKNFDKFILIFAPSDSRHKSSEKNRSRFWQVKSASFYVSISNSPVLWFRSWMLFFLKERRLFSKSIPYATVRPYGLILPNEKIHSIELSIAYDLDH